MRAKMRLLYTGGILKTTRPISTAVIGIAMAMLLGGCSVVDKDVERKRNVDYTIAKYEDVPDEVKKIIEDKKENAFSTVISDRENTYIVVGYGRKNRSGYQIKLRDIYESDTDVFVRLEFMGPDVKSETGSEQSDDKHHYPIIIIKMECTQKSVNVMQ